MRRSIPFMILICLSAAGCTAGREGEVQAPTAPTPAAGKAASATPAAPQRQQPVSAAADEARLKAGGAVEAVVRLTIAPEYHVNANPASDKFYIATELTAAPQEGITPGKPAYPPGLTKKFQFADKPLSVYEGRPEIRLPLRAEASAAKGPHTLRAKVRVQPCDDTACLPPRDLEVNIPVVVE
jgi:DsbC/DsbD-like thiol-disulfide interchange protein